MEAKKLKSESKEVIQLRELLHDHANRFQILQQVIKLYQKDMPDHKMNNIANDSLKSCLNIFRDIRQEIIKTDEHFMALKLKSKNEQLIKFILVLKNKVPEFEAIHGLNIDVSALNYMNNLDVPYTNEFYPIFKTIQKYLSTAKRLKATDISINFFTQDKNLCLEFKDNAKTLFSQSEQLELNQKLEHNYLDSIYTDDETKGNKIILKTKDL